MDTNILIYGVIFLIGFVLGHILWPSKKNEYIETYNKEDDHHGSRSYSRNEESDNDDDGDDDNNEDECYESKRFYFISCKDMHDEWGNMFDILVDRKTRVQYIWNPDGEGITALINQEGKPLLYDGEFKEE